MGELINGRCPAEIKSGLRNMLETCADISGIKDTICQEMCCPYDDDNCCHETILMGALALIERLESEHEEFERLESERDAALAKVPKWISVEERLPPALVKVWMYSRRFDQTIQGMMSKSDPTLVFCEDGNDWHMSEITHWMPLPELPKEDE